ncbi:DUF881 domain-containing protein [Auraticoccus sp. F435]|uniref:DUF881 domain-containing protein n=2 Tax=Auraticoccus cholistanensis TaxID=2656650 RepID=A0A6A9UX24_9ACTN|nr:DUF881 domain-containing protein [Auraticoccus cholistanensis]MVA75787.1 DUF881 domain-containing protein [Auraticoccus cholistanensis]
MDLLNQILAEPLDPDYARVAARPGPRPRMRLALLGVAVACGVMFAAGSVQSTRSAPALAVEREQLLARVADQQAQQESLREQISATTAEVARLRDESLGQDTSARALQSAIAAAEADAAAVAVTGPGMVVVVDDAPGSTGPDDGRIIDVDLQMLVNGLWSSGAEAVSINGYRLSALTAIRGAGDAITVDYRSLTTPYRVEAIGDPGQLPSRFAESTGGQWWTFVRQNYDVDVDISVADELQLAADPTLALRRARLAGSGPS